MMTEKRKHYTAAFTREAVRLVSEQGDSLPDTFISHFDIDI
jgi:hypothetical protein